MSSSSIAAEPSLSTSSGSMDGLDHSWRQRVASHYQLSALNKSRLKHCIFFHYILSFAMLAKLTPFLLDQFNWFILSIEELEVPEPFAWEWFWMSSILASFFCLDALKKNSVKSLYYYMGGIVLLGYVPIIYCFFLWFNEVFTFLLSIDEFELADLVYWNDLPYGILWYAFIFLAFQVHSFSMYFSFKLRSAWLSRGTRRAD